MADELVKKESYITVVDKENVLALPHGFTGTITTSYLDHPDAGNERSPSDIDPSLFNNVSPDQAHYQGITINDRALDQPIFFGIRLHGTQSFLFEQADELVKCLLKAARINKDVAVVGMASTSYMHHYVGEMNRIFAAQNQGRNHPHISTEMIGLFENLSQALSQTTFELNESGINAASAYWQRALAALKAGRSIESTAPLAIAPRLEGGQYAPTARRHGPDSDLPPGQNR